MHLGENIFMTGRISMSLAALAFFGISASAAIAQNADDAALNSMNTCLSGATPTSEKDFMTRLNPALNDPDRVSWCIFLYVNSNAATAGNNNALFETWASDHDTFQTNPSWPGPGASEKPLHQPVLPRLAREPQGGLTPFVLPFSSSTQCEAGQLCVGEEVRRNRSTFDFIKDNKLFSRAGLKAYNKPIVFPPDSIEVKANWVPVSQLADFLGKSGAPADPKLYHLNTVTENGQPVQYALLSFHIISKMVPNWSWATFEHLNNPGRCDVLGCDDTFGANPPAVAPRSVNTPGLQYPNCTKSATLTALFVAAKIDPAFTNYCLKGSQTDFTDAQGVKTRLGNSVTEAGFLDSASCISCHGTAAFTFVTGGWAMNRIFLHNSTPIGATGPIDAGQFWLYPENDPTQEKRQPNAPIFRASDFVWSIPLCAVDDATGKSACAAK
jgi:hypothetical protein